MPLNGAAKRQVMEDLSSLICDVLSLNAKERQEFVVTRGQRLSGFGLDSLAIQELLIEIQKFYDLNDELELDPADLDLTVGQVADKVEEEILKEMEDV